MGRGQQIKFIITLKDKNLDTLFFRLLQFSAVSVFLGRAWQHLYWDAPFRALLWDEQLLSVWVTQFTSMDWETYITSMEVDDWISFTIKCFGGFYLLAALLSLFLKKVPRWLHYGLLIGAVGLIFLAFLYTKERFYSLGQFFEYTLQFSSPLFLYYWVNALPSESFHNKFLGLLKVAIALTFTCHGLYAIGYYPIPANFLEMTMNILGVGNETAQAFLWVAGILDFMVTVGIFLPWKWSRCFLGYAVFWGFGTTIARIWANFNWEWLDYVLLQWLHESVMRMPHFLIPFAVLIAFYQRNQLAK